MNREKVIEELVYLPTTVYEGFYQLRITHDLRDKVVKLLKEQEAVAPIRIDGKRNHFIKCGNCNYDLVTGFQFCPHCGRKVKWNES